MKTAFLGLGSNLGDRRWHLVDALRSLGSNTSISIVQGSSVYESKPVGVIQQPDFLNMVLKVETVYPPLSLLNACLGIEAVLKRERRERWGPRIIDLDVLTYDDQTSSDHDILVLPHPRMHERNFVLTPLAEIAPELSLKGVSVAVLAAQLGTEGLRRVASWSELSEAAGLPRPLTPPPRPPL